MEVLTNAMTDKAHHAAVTKDPNLICLCFILILFCLRPLLESEVCATSATFVLGFPVAERACPEPRRRAKRSGYGAPMGVMRRR